MGEEILKALSSTGIKADGESEKELNAQHLHPKISTVRILFRWLEPQEEKEMESGGGGKTGQMETQGSSRSLGSGCFSNYPLIS